MKALRLASWVCVWALLPALTEAGGLAVSGRASDLGLGVELTAGLSDKVNLRVGGNTFGYSRSFTRDDDEFDLDLDFRSVTGLLDWHPAGGGFRLSAGVMGNGNKAGFVGRSTSYEIGNRNYRAADVGDLTGTVEVGRTAGYAGLGWGNAVRKGRRVGILFDLGVAFQGSPKVALGATGPIAGSTEFQRDLRLEEQELADDARRFKYYPVVSLGVSLKVN